MADFNPIEFNLENPERHLLDYLPPFLRHVEEFQAVNAASEPEIKAAWQALSRVLGNRFLAEADGAGLAVWERELGIFAKDTDSLSLRRARIKAAWQRQPPYTLRWLRGWLDEICGAGNYTANVQDYTINILLAYERLNEPQALMFEIMNILKPLRPANMRLWPAMRAEPVIFVNPERFLPISLKMSFWFSNQPNDITLLHGRRRLDGSWKLDSTFRGVVMQSVELVMPWRERYRPMAAGVLLMPGIKLANHNRSLWPGITLAGKFSNPTRADSKRLELGSRFAEKAGAMGGQQFIKDTMWRLNGGAHLDGSKKLNAAIVTENI